MIKKYVKKPVVIEAIEYTGKAINLSDISEWTDGQIICKENGKIAIPTLEGTMTADIGDMIIKGVNGEFYPCKPDIFEKTYSLLTTSTKG